MNTALATLGGHLAERFGLTFDAAVLDTLKSTAFRTKEGVTDAQMTALLVIANQYGLNPWTREIYAYPDAQKGIVPVVGVDGWIRIINEHPQFDGVEFSDVDGAVTCTIHRKDRSRPTVVTEYLEECRRGTDPWKNMPRRMMRHKALIQCARVAFGFALYDEEEGQTIAAANGGLVIDAATGEIVPPPTGPQRKSARAPVAAAASVAPAAPAPATAAAANEGGAEASDSTGESVPAISAGQVAYLRNKLGAAKGIDAQYAEPAICERFGVARIEDLNVECFDEIKSELLKLL